MNLELLLAGLKAGIYVNSDLLIQLIILSVAVIKILPELAAYFDQRGGLVPVVFGVTILLDHVMEF